MRKTIRWIGWSCVATLVAFSAMACGGTSSPLAPLTGGATSAVGHHASSGASADVAAVRAITARFHDLDQAKAAGWNTAVTGCLTSPEGGQGVHYGNLPLIDGTVNMLEPELIMYEPRGNDTWHLVGVEYIVPFAAWTATSPPSLFGETFHRNEAFGIWVLHLWIWKPNPSGLHADWNPQVSCS